MQRIVPTILIAAALGLGPVAAVADPAAQRFEALRMLEEAFPDAAIRTMAGPAVQQLMHATALRHGDADQGQMFAYSALYLDEMQAAARDAMRDEATALVARYSLAELQALRSFAAEAGNATILREGDGLLAEVARSIDRRMLGRMDAALDRHAPPR